MMVRVTQCLMICLCCCKAPQLNKKLTIDLTFQGFKQLAGYPSGSTLAYHQDKLFLMGDDATNLLVLDSSLNITDSIELFEGTTTRIAKAEKADIESSEWIDGKLWLFGSGSSSFKRDNAFVVDYETRQSKVFNLQKLYFGLRKSGITQVNIEGAALVKNHLLLANRSNFTSKQNYLIFLEKNFITTAAPNLIPLNLPDGAGVSGITYLAEHDMLVFTASQENTTNSYNDGEIGGSYIGVINNISSKISHQVVNPDKLVALPSVDKEFEKQKIESVCATALPDGNYALFLVADNDDGTTKLFKLAYSL